MANREFQVTVPRAYKFREGWGVAVDVIWEGEDEDGNISERVADISVFVTEIREDRVRIVGGVPCVQVLEEYHMPVENFQEVEDLPYDDQHDLRTRWFATEEQARDHAEDVESTWRNPAPWQSFITL